MDKILVILNFGQATAIFGPFKKNNTCIPIKIYEGPPGDDEYILHEDLEDTEPELVNKINWGNLPRFTIGDNSSYDQHYQQWLIDKQVN